MKSLGTAVKQLFGSQTRTKASGVTAVREFGRKARWQTFAMVIVPKVIPAVQIEFMTQSTPTLWRPKSNGRIERVIGITLDGTCAMFRQ